jgi:hypothetical protein
VGLNHIERLIVLKLSKNLLSKLIPPFPVTSLNCRACPIAPSSEFVGMSRTLLKLQMVSLGKG